MSRRRLSLIRKASYTTGEVALILNVGQRTVAKLADNRELPSWLIPGRAGCRHRRINHNQLVAFALKHGIPLPEGFAPQSEKEQDSVPA